jgi:hypothetical protein
VNIDILDSAYTVWERSPTKDILFKRNTISFDPLIDIGGGDSPRAAPAVAASGNNVHVVWRSFFSGGQFAEIIHTRSTDGGGDFGVGGGNLSGTFGDSTAPAVAVSGDNVYVVWSDNSPGNFEILYRRSTDGGETFGDTVNLSITAGDSSAPAVAVSGDNVYVVWSDNSLGNLDIFYRRSTDGGANFGDTVNLTNFGGDSSAPAVAVSGNNVYVVFRIKLFAADGAILYRRSTDGGANFGDTVNLSITAGDPFAPAVAVSGNNVYVVWGVDPGIDNPGGKFVLYRRSTDGGANFGSTVNINDASGQRVDAPAVAASGDNVYVVWCDKNLDIYYRRSTDGGANFGSTVNISNDVLDSRNPAVAASSNLT